MELGDAVGVDEVGERVGDFKWAVLSESGTGAVSALWLPLSSDLAGAARLSVEETGTAIAVREPEASVGAPRTRELRVQAIGRRGGVGGIRAYPLFRSGCTWQLR